MKCVLPNPGLPLVELVMTETVAPIFPQKHMMPSLLYPVPSMPHLRHSTNAPTLQLTLLNLRVSVIAAVVVVWWLAGVPGASLFWPCLRS